jgi:phosphatidyl-myo-inositol dimannoside synthase
VRLAVITNDYPPTPGGIQQYVKNLVDRLPGDVLVLAARNPSAVADAGVRRGPGRFLWPTRSVLRWTEDAVADFAPDAFLFAAPAPLSLLGPALRRRFGAPYGVLTHGAEVTVPAAFPLIRRLIVEPLRSADVVFANSAYTARAVDRWLRRPACHLGAGVDADVFHPADSVRTRPVVGTVGRFVPRKGQADVVEAVAELARRGRDVELLVVGSGRLEARLRRLAASRGVPARFEVGVPWHRLPDLYREMDVFALPCRSRWMGLEAEGLGLVFLEAAASGLPVVAGDSGGAPETVRHGVTGFVVRDRSELVDALEGLVSNRARAVAMGRRGRARMREDYSWDAVVARLIEGLEEARRRFRRPAARAPSTAGAPRPGAAAR